MRRITAAVAVLAACGWVLLGQDVPARMDEVVQRYAANRQFMGSVLVARDAGVLFDKGYGFANLEWDTPNTPDTKFRLGSITKQFTAACVLLLEERGKLKTDALVKKYLPDAPAAWDKITIYNLLTHTSGIPNLTAFPDYRSTMMLPSPPEKTVARFRGKPLDFQPGEKFSYSNSNYILLGYLIEKITGQSYVTFLQENVLTPLGLKDTGYDSQSAIIRHRALGYTPRPGGMVNAGYVDMTIPYAAGALYSTTGDLLRWEQGLFGGKLLAAESLRKMTTPFKGGYGCGLLIQTTNGHKVIQHGGSINGFNTFLAYYPEDKLTVVVLSNMNTPVVRPIAQQLGALAHGEKVTLPAGRK
jgi:CubicO group peptidase (beta-lactamase class C family)